MRSDDRESDQGEAGIKKGKKRGRNGGKRGKWGKRRER
jgi:hypothetical protein